MKPTLTKTLLPLILAAATAHADYNGTAIVNQDTAHTGNIIIEGNIDDDYTKDINHGAVELSGTEGSNKTITLEGNIAISAGTSHASDESAYKTFGIYVGWAGERVPEDENLNNHVSNAHVILKTVNSTDSITIDTYSYGAYGIGSYSPGSTVTLDASSSSQPIRITTRGTSAGGIRARYGDVILKGDSIFDTVYSAVNVTGANVSASGSLTASSSVGSTFNVNEGGQINITGDSTITSESAQGIYANKGSQVKIGGAATITSQTAKGIYANVGSQVEILGKTTITAKTYGVDSRALNEGTASSVKFAGDVTVNSQGAGLWSTLGGSMEVKGHATVSITGTELANCAAIAAGSTSGGIVSTVKLNGATITAENRRAIISFGGTVTGNSALYRIDGNIFVQSGGEIDLTTNYNSLITGATYLKNYQTLANSTGTINLNLQGDSLWQVTDNSQLTNLTLGQGSALQLAFSGTSLTDIITATETITLETGSVIYLTGDLSALQGASFDFFNGTVDNQGVQFLGFDGTDWVEYEYTQTGANTFEFSANAPTVIEEPGFIKAIPEPATATLGLLGLASLLARRRRA